MASLQECDKCSRKITEDNPIVVKLFLAPVIRGKTRTTHSNYSGHMDIGQCCHQHVLNLGKWQKRKSREAYNNGRRLRAATPVEGEKKRPASKKK